MAADTCLLDQGAVAMVGAVLKGFHGKKRAQPSAWIIASSSEGNWWLIVGTMNLC